MMRRMTATGFLLIALAVTPSWADDDEAVGRFQVIVVPCSINPLLSSVVCEDALMVDTVTGQTWALSDETLGPVVEGDDEFDGWTMQEVIEERAWVPVPFVLPDETEMLIAPTMPRYRIEDGKLVLVEE